MKKFSELLRRKWPIFLAVAALIIAALIPVIVFATQPKQNQEETSLNQSDETGSSSASSWVSSSLDENSSEAESSATENSSDASSELSSAESSEPPIESSGFSSEPVKANYKVRRYKENVMGGFAYYDELEEEGIANEETAYVAPAMEGFHVAPFQQIVPLADEENFLDIYYQRNVYELTFNIWDDNLLLIVDGFVALAVYEEEVSIDSELLDPTALFLGWYEDDVVFDSALDFSFSMPARDLVLTGRVTRPDKTRYLVRHHRENPFAPGTFYDPDREVCYGDAGALTEAVAKPIEGAYESYQARAIEQKNIDANGLTVVDVYYDAVYYDIVIETKTGGGTADVSNHAILAGGTVNFVCDPDPGYLFLGYYDEKGILFDSRGNFSYTMSAKSLHLYARFGEGDALYTIEHVYNRKENADSSEMELYTLEYRAGYIGQKTDAESLDIGEYYGPEPKSWIEQETITGNLEQTIKLYYRYGYFRLEIRETGISNPKCQRHTTRMGGLIPIIIEPPAGYELEGAYFNGNLYSEESSASFFMPMANVNIVINYGTVTEEKGVKVLEKDDGQRVAIGISGPHFTVDVPADVVRIRGRAFSACHTVKKLVLPFTGLEPDDVRNNVNTMFDWGSSSAPYASHSRLAELNEATLLDGCRHISPGSFSCCTKLAKVKLADSIEDIGEGAFYRCSSLPTGFALPANLTFVGKKAFALNKTSSPISLSYPGTKEDFQTFVTLDSEWQDGSIGSIVCSNGSISF